MKIVITAFISNCKIHGPTLHIFKFLDI